MPLLLSLLLLLWLVAGAGLQALQKHPYPAFDSSLRAASRGKKKKKIKSGSPAALAPCRPRSTPTN